MDVQLLPLLFFKLLLDLSPLIAFADFVAKVITVSIGIISVKAFVQYNHLSMKKAVSTSLFCTLITATFNCIKHYFLGNTYITPLIMIIIIIPFTYLGAKLTTSLKNKTLVRVF